jgi:hypothetical protein
MADSKFMVGDTAKVKVDRPEEYTEVRKGATAVVESVRAGDGTWQIFGTWQNPDADANHGYILEEHLEKTSEAPKPLPFKLMDLVECTVNQPAEKADVIAGARGVVYSVTADRVYAMWVNPASPGQMSATYTNGYVLHKNARKVAQGDLVIMIDLLIGQLVEKLDYKVPSASEASLRALGKSWTGSVQGLLEMLYWVKENPDVQMLLMKLKMANELFTKTIVKPAKKEEVPA